MKVLVDNGFVVSELSVAASSVTGMEAGIEQLTDGHLLAGIDAALDALNDDRLRLPTDRELLDLLLAALRVDARLPRLATPTRRPDRGERGSLERTPHLHHHLAG